MPQIRVDDRERRLTRQQLQQIAPHRDDLAGGSRCEIEPAEELLPRAFHCGLQPRQRLLRRLLQVGRSRLPDFFLPRLQRVREELEERTLLLAGQTLVEPQDLISDGNTGRLAAYRYKRLCELGDVLAGVPASPRPLQQLPPLLGNRSEQLLQKRNIRHDRSFRAAMGPAW